MGCGIVDADEGTADAGRAAVGVGTKGRHMLRVRSITSEDSIVTNAAAYSSRLILDSATIYSANSCIRSASDVALVSLRTNSWCRFREDIANDSPESGCQFEPLELARVALAGRVVALLGIVLALSGRATCAGEDLTSPDDLR